MAKNVNLYETVQVYNFAFSSKLNRFLPSSVLTQPGRPNRFFSAGAGKLLQNRHIAIVRQEPVAVVQPAYNMPYSRRAVAIEFNRISLDSQQCVPAHIIRNSLQQLLHPRPSRQSLGLVCM